MMSFHIVVISMLGVLILAGIMTIIWASQKRPDASWLSEIPSNKMNVVKIVIALVVIHCLIAFIWTDLWIQLAELLAFWVIQAAIVLVYIFFKEKDQTGRREKIIFPGNLIILIVVAGGIYTAVQVYQKNPPAKSLETITDIYLVPPRPPINEENEVIVRKFFQENIPEELDPEQMVRIIRDESGFNQYESNGSTVLRARTGPKTINPDVVGIAQISASQWGPFANAMGYDIYTMDGNLNMALWIRLHCGADEWSTSGLPKDLCTKFILTAPVEGVSEKVPTAGKFARFQPAGPVWIYTDWCSPPGLACRIKSGPEKKYIKEDIGQTEFVQFQAREVEGTPLEAVQVTVSYK